MGSIYFSRWMRYHATSGIAGHELARKIDRAEQYCSQATGYRGLLHLPQHLVSRGQFTEVILLEPDIFVPGETYVPMRWDFADLADVVASYAANAPRRAEISRNAYAAMHQFARSERFVDQLERLFEPLP